MTGLWAGHGSEILSSLLAAWANHSFPGPQRFDNSHLSSEAADVGAGVKCRSHLSYCFLFPQALLQPHAVTRTFRPFTCPFASVVCVTLCSLLRFPACLNHVLLRVSLDAVSLARPSQTSAHRGVGSRRASVPLCACGCRSSCVVWLSPAH